MSFCPENTQIVINNPPFLATNGGVSWSIFGKNSYICAEQQQIRMKFTFRKGCKVREIAGENVVILQGSHVSDMTRIIALNESSLLLWNELYGKEFCLQDVVDTLLGNYDVDAETATADAGKWVDKLLECGLVLKSE